MTVQTDSYEETFEFARSVGKEAKAGEVYALTGDLGAGKTAFAQGFAKGLEIEEYVLSPTFTIMQVYEDGRLPLYHFDVYRIGDISEMDEIGYEDYFFGEGVSIIEWADMIDELIPDDAVRISIRKMPEISPDHRQITLEKGS